MCLSTAWVPNRRRASNPRCIISFFNFINLRILSGKYSVWDGLNLILPSNGILIISQWGGSMLLMIVDRRRWQNNNGTDSQEADTIIACRDFLPET